MHWWCCWGLADCLLRGADEGSGHRFSDVDLEGRVPASHPLRAMRGLGNPTLAALDGAFCVLRSLCAAWPSTDPAGAALRAILLELLASIRLERQVVERLQFDLWFRWCVGLGVDAAVWAASTFAKNRSLVLTTALAQGFRSALLARPEVRKRWSARHFSLDATMLKAFASMQSFGAKDGSDAPQAPGCHGERDFKPEALLSETHAATTDPDARLCRKGKGQGKGQGQENRLADLGHGLLENRNGLGRGRSDACDRHGGTRGGCAADRRCAGRCDARGGQGP